MNWEIRLKNKTFWLTFIPALLLFIQMVLSPFGIHWEIKVLETDLINIVNALFAVLTIIGVAVDPTTVGIGDSQQAMNYTEPK